MRQHSALLYLLLVVSFPLHAASPYQPTHPDPLLEPWRWTVFPELRGLGLRCMAEDKQGRMWFGVDDGVQIYDGVTWTSYTQEDGILGKTVVSLCATRDGGMYAGTDAGISLHRNGTWERVFPPADSSSWDVSKLMQASGGSVGAATDLGALRIGSAGTTLFTTQARAAVMGEQAPNAQLHFVLVPDGVVRAVQSQVQFSVYDVAEDRDGGIWLGLRDGRIARYDPSQDEASAWRLYTDADGLDLRNNPRIIQTRDGTIWAGCHDLSSINQYDGADWALWRPTGLERGIRNHCFLETRDGVLWSGGWGGTLYVVRNGVWSTYSREDLPLPATRITGLLEASDGAVWLLGDRQEAVRLDYDTSRWRTFEGLWYQCETPDGVQWFTAVDGAGTDASVAVQFDGRTWTRYGQSEGLMDRVHGVIATRKGEVWAVGSEDSMAATARFGPSGTSGRGGDRWSARTHPNLSWGLTRLAAFEAADGSLWFGARTDWSPERGHKGGILRFDGETWTHHTPTEAPPNSLLKK